MMDSATPRTAGVMVLALLLLAGCAAEVGDQTGAQVGALHAAGMHGFMIVSDTDVSLVFNAFGGARDGAPIRLAQRCRWENGNCTWTYYNGMIVSDEDPSLAITAPALHVSDGAPLVLSNKCTAANLDCTWTYKQGLFVSDRDPSLGINAFGGATESGEVKLNRVCGHGTTHSDCRWSMTGAMISASTDEMLAVNAFGGAQRGTALQLNTDCSRDNPDCTWHISNGMILSSRNEALAWNAFGGAAHLAPVQLNRCKPSNPDCTWTFHRGTILSDRNNMMVNSFGGAQSGAPLLLHQDCTMSNPDCLFASMIGGEQCGHRGEGVCPGDVCFDGTRVGKQCLPVQTQKYDCGVLNTGTVAGNATLYVSNTGNWEFKGHASTGEAFGYNYGWGVALAAKNSEGAHFATSHSGVVHGSFDIGSNSDDFDDHGHDSTIPDAWPRIAVSDWDCNLESSTNGWLLLEDILVGASIVGGAVSQLSGGKPQCKEQYDEDDFDVGCTQRDF
jgi:hypothetical protein